MNEHQVIEDAANNPFLVSPRVRTWHTEDVADIHVHTHLRKAIDRLQFYLRHPIMNEEPDEAHVLHLRSELRRFNDLLNKAHYNYFIKDYSK